MLIFCAGMYRACSTWQYGVVDRIYGRGARGHRLGFVWGGDFDRKLVTADFDDSVGYLKTHDAHDRFAEELAAGRAVGLYSHRDLRDVAFSWVHKTGLDFDHLVERGFFELCLENDRYWRAQPGVLVQSYADLVARPAWGVAEIAGHLGVDLDDRAAAEIAEALSIEANRGRTRAMEDRLRASGDEPSSLDQSRHDPESLLHWNHIREGRQGGWRDQATPDQRAILAYHFGPWLVANGYEADDSWAPRPTPEQARRAVARASYAAHGEDILLDRVFRGRKGTYLDIDAADPIRSNSTYYFYLRGWRGLNVGTGPRPRDRFVADRPEDRNLAIRPPYTAGLDPAADGPPIISLAGVIADHRFRAPEIVAVSAIAGSDLAATLADLPLADWRPSVVLVDPVGSMPAAEAADLRRWEPSLLARGYRPAGTAGPSRVYLRDDLGAWQTELARPISTLDPYELAIPPLPPSALSPSPEVESLRADVAAHAVERSRWAAERAGLDATIEATRLDRARLEAHAARLESKAVRLEGDVARLEADVARLEADVARLDVAFHRERSRATDDRRSAGFDRDRLEAELARAGADRDAAIVDLDRLRTAVEAAGRDLLASRRELRPYRLIDRLGVVGKLHRRLRPIKSILPSHRPRPR